MKITKSFSFAMGHRLALHRGKCSNFHGHNYDIEIDIDFGFAKREKYIGDVGFLVDFSDLKKYVEERFDHKFLMQDTDPFTKVLREQKVPGLVVVSYAPTAENMAIDIATGLKEFLISQNHDAKDANVIVRLWETKTSIITQQS